MAMDFISGPTTTRTTTTTPTTPDSDTDTPPHPPPSKRPHHHHNNNHHHHHHQHVSVSYKECLKNHAASIGGHALDGCCEFMPGPTANPLDPTSLTCAACGCHRNFHRRDPDDPTPLHHLIPLQSARRPHSPPSASQLLLSLSGAQGQTQTQTQSPSAPSDHELMHNPTAVGYYNNNGGGGGGGQNGNFQNKKRYRTKFSQEQKEKMYEFSEKIGWKLKKGEERLVEEFCKEVGVDRTVFKVWMHNNKHSATPPASTTSSSSKMVLATEKLGISNGIGMNSTHSGNNNANTNNNVSLNCGGVLANTGLEFSFANGIAGGQEAKAQ